MTPDKHSNQRNCGMNRGWMLGYTYKTVVRAKMRGSITSTCLKAECPNCLSQKSRSVHIMNAKKLTHHVGMGKPRTQARLVCRHH